MLQSHRYLNKLKTVKLNLVHVAKRIHSQFSYVAFHHCFEDELQNLYVTSKLCN